MIDDAFLRQVAALQANLKMLESQQDALSDFQDMQALRLYKSRLSDYIEAHVCAGDLPRDPFRVVEQRLIALSEFFTAADQEYQHLKGWKADWLNSVPAVGLADLQFARTKLAELIAEVPHVQERLGQSLSPLDWDTSSPSAGKPRLVNGIHNAGSPLVWTSSLSVDLHTDLVARAQCVSGLKFPQSAARRNELYQFAHGVGDLAKKTSSHFTALGLRIEELIALHADHVKAVAETEQHLLNHDFRSAQNAFKSLAGNRFLDIDYEESKAGRDKLKAVLEQFTSLDACLDQGLKTNNYKAVTAALERLRGLIRKPDSELGRESLAILERMNSRFAIAQEASKKASEKRRVRNFAMLAVLGLVVAAATLLVINEQARAERVRIEAEAKAERDEAEYAKSSGNRAGEEKITEITPGVTMTFCWCPAGKFTMGSPKSEKDRNSDENQAEVTLSKGFWMAQTQVTQAQWQAVMGTDPSYFKGANRPVEQVRWHDAQEFVSKINASFTLPDGMQMTLPTEAQWEYAARAGETGPYSGGALDEVAWYHKNSDSKTHPVGTKKPNAWGLHDTSGNVWEWCSDYYASKLEGGIDPQGASSGGGRVFRGGSWYSIAGYRRVAYRGNNYPSVMNDNLGFRVARSSAS
jgi:formylglycine-generating enzyme required for sulfatase activity